MKKLVVLSTVTSLLLLATALSGAETGAAPAPVARDPGAEVGGRWFFCAMSQTIKYYGLFTANPGLVLAGAIGGGLACGMGW